MDMRSRTADLLLQERGAKFTLRAPLLLRPFLPRHLYIRSPRLGTLLHCARIALDARLDDLTVLTVLTEERPSELMLRQARPLSEMIAVAILDSRPGIRLLRKPLARLLRREYSVADLVTLAEVVMEQWRVEDFTTTTASVSRMSVILLEPRTGPRRERSQETTTPPESSASIASSVKSPT